MKIRNGFVSNSSSSSFVLVGFKQPDSVSQGRYSEWYEWCEDNDLSCYYIDGYGAVTGKEIQQFSDDVEMSISTIDEYNLRIIRTAKDLLNLCSSMGFTPDIRIYSGTVRT